MVRSNAALSIAVAMTPEQLIGRNGDLPWYIPSDLARFKRITIEAGTVIMGRKTHESILRRLGKPLPGRRSIVLTRSPGGEYPETAFVDSVPAALAIAGTRACVIGGGTVFAEFLEHVERLELTIVEDGGRLKGDAYFPRLAWGDEWEKIEISLPEQRDPRDEFETAYETWVRKR
jgi:dihydrofolate reductase